MIASSHYYMYWTLRGIVLQSALLNIPNNTCIGVTGFSNQTFKLHVNVAHKIISIIEYTEQDPIAYQWRISLPGAVSTRIQLVLLEGMFALNSIEILDTENSECNGSKLKLVYVFLDLFSVPLLCCFYLFCQIHSTSAYIYVVNGI